MTDTDLLEQVKAMHDLAAKVYQLGTAMNQAVADVVHGSPSGRLGTVDEQRECRRRVVRAQAVAIAAIEGKDAADRFQREELAKVERVSHCPECRLELIGDDPCPRDHGYEGGQE